MNDLNKYRILLPIASSLMLGLTRTTLPLDMLVFVAFVPLFYYFELAQTDKWHSSPLLCGVVFSTVYMLVSQHWITLVTPGGFIGMLFLFAVIFGGMFWVVAQMHKYQPILHTLCFVFIWLCFEYVINFSEFRFPWFNIAYGLKDSLSLLQVLEFGGVFFLSFMILVINRLFFISFMRKGWFIAIPLVLLSLWFLFGTLRMQYVQRHSVDEEFRIALLQGNVPQDIKWAGDMRDSTFVLYEQLAYDVYDAAEPDLIVYPEAALPVNLLQDDRDFVRVWQLVTSLQTPLFLGFPHYEIERKYRGQDSPFLYYNASTLFTPDTVYGPYYKNILVPFGERTPLLHIFPFLWKLQMGQANFEMGDEVIPYEIDGLIFAPLICFEVAFPLFIRKTVEEFDPDFWVNITNDAWFYRSIGTDQHAKMVVFRTIETRKPFFRVANTGYTFWTTPDGRMHDTTALFERKAIVGNLTTYNTETPFVLYGYLFPLIFVLFFTGQITHLLFLLFQKRFLQGVRVKRVKRYE